MSEKQIYTVNYEIPGFSHDYHSFYSNVSLMDADIVLFAPGDPGDTYDNYNGKPSYSDYQSTNQKENTAHWKKELQTCLEAGKVVFVMLAQKESFYLKTGTREYKGKTTINHVSEHTNYEFLPVRIGGVVNAKGKTVLPTSGLTSGYCKDFKNHLSYQCYLENTGEADLIFTPKDKSKALGTITKVGAGYLVTLPYLEYDHDEFTKEVKGELLWKKPAIRFGEKLRKNLLDISQSISAGVEKSTAPSWAQEYSSVNEEKIRSQISDIEKDVEKAERKLKKKQQELLLEEETKTLLYETGKPLENSVITALKLLGYEAESYDDGTLELDQVINSPEGERYIGECEGKDNKDIDISKLRQLLDSLNEDFAREEVEEKAFGILFGNPQRLTDPAERGQGFTEKCIKAAKREKVALVKTPDLYEIVNYLKQHNDEEFKKLCRDAIHSSLGEIVFLPKVPTK